MLPCQIVLLQLMIQVLAIYLELKFMCHLNEQVADEISLAIINHCAKQNSKLLNFENCLISTLRIQRKFSNDAIGTVVLTTSR